MERLLMKSSLLKQRRRCSSHTQCSGLKTKKRKYVENTRRTRTGFKSAGFWKIVKPRRTREHFSTFSIYLITDLILQTALFTHVCQTSVFSMQCLCVTAVQRVCTMLINISWGGRGEEKGRRQMENQRERRRQRNRRNRRAAEWRTRTDWFFTSVDQRITDGLWAGSSFSWMLKDWLTWRFGTAHRLCHSPASWCDSGIEACAPVCVCVCM